VVLADPVGVAALLVDCRQVVEVSRDLAASVADQMNRSTVLTRHAALVVAACRSEQLRTRTLLVDRQHQAAAGGPLVTAGVRAWPPASVDVTTAAAEGRSRRFGVPDGAEACAVARRVLAFALQAWGVHDAQWTAGAEVVVSELVSNAVRHGGGCKWVELHLDQAGLTVQVADRSATRPQPRTADSHALSGRGLALIDAMTDGWNTADHDGGKRVWATLGLHRRQPPLRLCVRDDQQSSSVALRPGAPTGVAGVFRR
jgi:anti-sigma regulatory factor (Ser/Thr protein kinase)